MSSRALIIIAFGLLSGCATTLGEVTEEERARCIAMKDQMGVDLKPSHTEQHGVRKTTPMNREHKRCKAILEQASKP